MKLRAFTEVGIKHFLVAREKYQSVSGHGEEDEDFATDIERLRTLTDTIRGDLKPHVKETDAEIYRIALSCHREASALVEALDRLGVGNGRHRGWESFRKALKQLWKSSEIQKKERKLKKLQGDLTLHLVTASKKDQSSILSILQQLKLHNLRLEAKTMAELNKIQTALGAIQTTEQNTVSRLVSQLEKLTTEVPRVKRQQMILQSLYFDKIKDRQTEIKDHHKNTFKWVLASKSTPFSQWLMRETDILWVKGKPGSGKSTLMKFLATHDNTKKRLRSWGRKDTVVVAGHFFWIVGTPMQKNLLGLWRTLLYQVLKECPTLIETVCASRWAEVDGLSVSEPWHKNELYDVMEIRSSQTSLDVKFCFFVDGLDEYTGGEKERTGGFQQLINPLKTLASSPSIKICVSSRPWTKFDEILGQEQQVRLEDLTREDIRRCVEDELGGNLRFQKLASEDKRSERIPDLVVERADGGFLWVYLVIRSLERGLVHADNYPELRKRLDALPSDLEKYFQQMLKSIDPFYKDQTLRIFQTAIAAEQSLPLLGFKFLDQELEEPGYSVKMEPQQWSLDEVKDTCQSVKERLDGRYRDLLYFREKVDDMGLVFRFRVDFLHRTVRDFFLNTSVLDDLVKEAKEEAKREGNQHDFDPHPALCNMMLALTKLIVLDDQTARGWDQLFTLTDSLMYHARRIEESIIRSEQTASGPRTQPSQVFVILDELDRSISKRQEKARIHWTIRRNPTRASFHYKGKGTLIAAAVQAGLELYVKHCLSQDKSQLRKVGRLLLDYALQPTMDSSAQLSNSMESPMLGILEYILKLKANPNDRISSYDEQTLWEGFLSECYWHASRGSVSESTADDIARALQLMIENGADITCTIEADDTTQVGVAEVIHKFNFRGAQLELLEDLMSRKNGSGSWLSWVSKWAFRM
ncbi:NACHT domain-containing protein [Fusarium sp. LHS14.1]|nr:NACHT domain-containing protein [Fusarium sp. LHS14.1]